MPATVLPADDDLEPIRKPNPVRLVADDQHPEVPGWHCAGLQEHHFQAMRMKWAGDWSGANALEYRLWLAAVDLSNAHGWRVPTGQERLRRMAGLAIAELADPARYSRPDSWQLKAAWLGVGKSQWYDTWQARYEQVYRVLDDWSNAAWHHMRRRQQRRETQPEKSILAKPGMIR